LEIKKWDLFLKNKKKFKNFSKILGGVLDFSDLLEYALNIHRQKSRNLPPLLPQLVAMHRVPDGVVSLQYFRF